ncbi:hypothetical protein Hanom_Chr16g01471021 [Helianthus anomalus]
MCNKVSKRQIKAGARTGVTSVPAVMSLVAGYGFATFGHRKGINRSWLMTVAVVIDSCGSSTSRLHYIFQLFNNLISFYLFV